MGVGFGESRPRIGANNLSRRALLGGAAAVAGTVGLAACGPDEKPAGTNSTGPSAGAGPAEPPAYVPFEGVTPDLAPTEDGVPPGFYNFPDPPLPQDGYPLAGMEPFTALLQGDPPGVAPEDNKNYQWMAEQLGTEFETIFGTYTSYTEKFQVTMSGNDLPDLVQVIQVAELPRLLETNFTDLTDILAGDNITKYPGLANIPSATWKLSTVNGRIYGVARPQPPTGLVINYRDDIIAERGLTADDMNPQSGDEFLALMTELTDKDNDVFAMGADPTVWLTNIAKQMAGTPNRWAREGDTFVSDIASEQMKDALAFAAKVWAAGVMHPNSFSDPSQNGVWYDAGVTALFIRGYGGWDYNIRANPDTTIRALVPPKLDGGGAAPVHKSAAGYSAFIGLAKTDDADRIDQLLRVCDFCASPFGTEQYLGFNYGVEGYSYEMDGVNPVPLPDAPQTPDSYTYAGGNRNAVLYSQGDQQSVDLRHEYASLVIPDGIDDASTGLYSDTLTSKGATMNKEQTDVIRQVIQGGDMAIWDEFVQQWKSEVGDPAAQELAEAAAAAG